jgi:aryl-alcohol dehydrogenase-like predicted oxidoreductase
MQKVSLGHSSLRVRPIGLGAMSFGEAQVDAHDRQHIFDHAMERGVDFIDTAEMYPAPPSAGVCSASKSTIGDGLRRRAEVRVRRLPASKAAGPVRSHAWPRHGSADAGAEDIVVSCESSARRACTEHVDAFDTTLAPEVLAATDRLRRKPRHPAR